MTAFHNFGFIQLLLQYLLPATRAGPRRWKVTIAIFSADRLACVNICRLSEGHKTASYTGAITGLWAQKSLREIVS